ncbi:hypothetical protein Tco_1398782, partial [Tanacetum coccineum]
SDHREPSEESTKAWDSTVIRVLIIERPRGVYKGWDSKIPNLLGSPLPLQQTLSGVQWGLTPTSVNSAHAPSKGGRDSRVSRESTTGIGCSDKQPSRSSRHRTANIWELQLQLSAS